MIAIDLSLRSSGIVSINDSTLELEGFKIISNKELHDEELIIENCREIVDFCFDHYHANIAVEGISFNSVSSSKDIIAGQYWYLRTKLYKCATMQIVPVQRWRCAMFDKEKRAGFKGEKDGLKQMVVAGLPEEVTKQFNEYIISHDLKKKALFDLADAYFLGIYAIGQL